MVTPIMVIVVVGVLATLAGYVGGLLFARGEYPIRRQTWTDLMLVAVVGVNGFVALATLWNPGPDWSFCAVGILISGAVVTGVEGAYRKNLHKLENTY